MKSLFRNCYFVFIVLKHSYCYSGGFVVAYGVRQLNRVNIVERITVGSFWFCLGFFVGFIIVIVTVILFWALEKWLVVNFFSGLKRQLWVCPLGHSNNPWLVCDWCTSVTTSWSNQLLYGLFGWRGEGGGVEGSRVVYAKNKLILY